MRWDRDAIIAKLRDRIWLHLSGSAVPHEVQLEAAALLQLPFHDVARLGHLHFLLDPRVGAFLDAAPTLLRRPASDTTPVTEIAHDRIRGPVDWPATYRLRALTREPTVVTHPRVRQPDVQPNRLLALLLTEIRDLARSFSTWGDRANNASAATRMQDVGTRAGTLTAHRALQGVTPAHPTDRERATLDGVRLRRRFAAALAAYDAHRDLVRHADATAVRRSVERHGLAASSDGALFELLVVFGVRDALEAIGFIIEPMRLFEGALRFTASRGDVRVTGHYQRVPTAWGTHSRYRSALRAHRLTSMHDLRPDLVLQIEVPGRTAQWIVVEAKTTTETVGAPHLARRALTDLLAYRATFDHILTSQTRWGLGVVWGQGLTAADHEIAICTPDRLDTALADLVEHSVTAPR